MKNFLPVLKLFKNFYFSVGLFAMIWMLLFDQYSIPARMRMASNIDKLEEDMNFYNFERAKLSKMTEVRGNDLKELERFARERHWMKKDDEDLYIIVEK